MDNLWTIIDAESDNEIGTVSWDGISLSADTYNTELDDAISNIDLSDPDEFPQKLFNASRGQFVAVPEDTGSGDDEFDMESAKVEEAVVEPEEQEPAEEKVQVIAVEGPGAKALGSILVEATGKITLDIEDAALHGLLLLEVLPALEQRSVTPAQPGYPEELKRAIEAMQDTEGKGRRYAVVLREASAPVRWGSTSPQWSGPAAPWSPVPLSAARDFVKQNPDAALEVNFPTVFEEDRSAKIKDIMTGDVSGYISHRRSAEQYAKEMGFEQFDYDDEQQEISQEKPKDAIPPDLQGKSGSGGLAQSIGSTIGGHLGNAGPKPGGIQQAEDEDEDGVPRMAAVGDDAAGRHSFRMDQKRLAESDRPQSMKVERSFDRDPATGLVTKVTEVVTPTDSV